MGDLETMRNFCTCIVRLIAVATLALSQLVLLAGSAHPAQADVAPLVWGDEFNGTQLDHTKWRPITGDGAAWYGSNYYLPTDLAVANGALMLKSERRAVGPRNYTSGGVSSRGLFSFTYGLVEWRAWVPGGAGVWPALWLMPADGSWPPEIDAMENMGTSNIVTMTYHWRGGQSSVTTTVPHLTAGYHTFAVRWQPGEIDWLIDGQQARAPYISPNVPNKPMFLYMNTAVCDGCQTCHWCGRPASNSFPQAMRIDYVRVYRSQPANPAPMTTQRTSRLAGMLIPGAVTTNLSREGTDDWVSWGNHTATDIDRKTGVTPQISNFGLVGGYYMLSGGGGSTLTWTNGRPALAGTNAGLGAVVCGANRGFTFSVPADRTARTLTVYVTVFKAAGRFTATLSDGSARAYVNMALNNSTAAATGVYRVHFAAASAGQSLTLLWTTGVDHGGGCVVLEGATLQG
jgi:beta-glucanase (GH16 family)